MEITIIAAVAENGAIGYRNKLLYWLPDDLKRFKRLTTGHTIIMGRKTFESFPKGALPNRRNVVLTRRSDAVYEGAEVFHSLEDALAACRGEQEVYIIGGAAVYKEAIPLVDRLCLTEVADTPALADAFFPAVDNALWEETGRETHPKDADHPFGFAFVDYKRKRPQRFT